MKKSNKPSSENLEKAENVQEKKVEKITNDEKDVGEVVKDGGEHDPLVLELTQKLEKAEREAKENFDRLIRLQADFENYKKRIAKEKTELIEYGREDVIKALLPIMDDLANASTHIKNESDINSLVKGVEMIHKKISDTLEKHGVKEIKALGEKFDPALHEAMLHIESVEYEPNLVIDELRKGYLINKRLLRPSMVKVSKLPTETKTDSNDLEEGEDQDQNSDTR